MSKLLASHDEDPSSEFSVRRLLIAALFAAGNEKTSDQTTAKANPAVADTGEPSWAALGLMVRETSFVQVWSRIFFEWAMLGVSPDESLQELRPLYVDHRFGEYLDMYSWDETAKSNAVKKVQSVNTNDAMLQHYLFSARAWNLTDKIGKEWTYNAFKTADFTSSDMQRALMCRVQIEKKYQNYIKDYAVRLTMSVRGRPTRVDS